MKLLHEICSVERAVPSTVLEDVLSLAVEIAREGREGRKVGTLFTLGDSAAVIKASIPLILDPLAGHAEDRKRVDDPDLRETIKELAQLDGAFVVREDGVVLSACRYLNASARGIRLPLGLGSRHMAAASVSRRSNAVAVVVSESSIVRVFDDGELTAEILPELWLLSRYSLHITEPYIVHTDQRMTVARKKEVPSRSRTTS